jgi:tetratricopeptide (TPR) repeat protein
MTSEQWSKAEELFHRAVEVPPSERAALLDSCGDPNLRREVESLLANAGDGDAPTLTAVAGLAAEFAEDSDPDRQRIGQRLGPYRIDGILGHGGMGAVFSAARDDDQYQKRVAIKLVRAAVASPESLSRFRRERQILARLEHHYIGRLLDGGVTDDGLPYLVMEFIDGQSIIEYCEKRKLSLNDRVALFRKVCEAVEYAHRNLVVHRDLKPGNIMVTADGTPKLLDFGIARLVDPPAEEGGETFQTVTMAVNLTPAYASPEQVRGDPVSTASDVYSLGAVLYEMLTGARAHRFTSGGMPVEWIRVICETEVTRPSAAFRGAERDRKKLRGDLDNIVLKAMRKEAARRYGSVAEFSLDLERYLDRRPVIARPDTWLYRTGKFVRRNWAAVLAASLAIAGICAAGGIAVYQARMAQERFGQVRKLANRFLFDFYGQIATVPGTTKAKEMVVSTALEYLDQLSKSAGRDVDLQLELANAYEKVGTVEGYPGDAGNLGRIRDAAASYRKAIAIYERIGERNDVAMYNLARCSMRLSYLLQRMGSRAEGEELQRKAGPIIDGLLRKAPNNLDYLTLGAQYSKLRAIGERDQSHAQAALYAVLQSRDYRRRILKARDTPKDRFEVIIEEEEVADARMSLGDFEQARLDVGEALKMLKAAMAANARQSMYRRALFIAYTLEAGLQDDDESPCLGNPAEALVWAEKALALTEDVVKADPHDAQGKGDLSWALDRVSFEQRSQPGQAVESARRAVALQDELAPLGYPAVKRANIVRRLAVSLLNDGKAAEGLQRVREALAVHEAGFAKDANNRETLILTLLIAGDALQANGKSAESGEKYQEAVKLAEPLLTMPTSPARLLNAERAMLRYADYCVKAGREGEARELYQRILKGWSAWDKPNPYTERKKTEAIARR